MNILDLDFIKRAKEQHLPFFLGKHVLELGALDVNGNVRDPFDNCTFVGVDWIEGKNVDVVAKASETTFEPETFDVLLSVNQLEHDPEWQDTLGHNLPAIKKGGLILLRWGSTRSAPHGPEFDPHGKLGYYGKDIPEIADFLKANGCKILDSYEDHNPYIGIMANIVASKI